MRIGIVGAGRVGTGLGRRLASFGNTIVVSLARAPQKVHEAAELIGSEAVAGSPTEAVRHGEVVIVATRWAVTLDVVHQLAPYLLGKVVWDTTTADGA